MTYVEEFGWYCPFNEAECFNSNESMHICALQYLTIKVRCTSAGKRGIPPADMLDHNFIPAVPPAPRPPLNGDGFAEGSARKPKEPGIILHR